ncbi:MAG: ATP-binding protein [Salibacteraceae bacterium]
MQKNLDEIKELVINRICILTALTFAPAYVLSILRWISIGWQNIYIAHSILYFAIIFVAIRRHKMNYWFKIVMISSVYFLVAFFGLINFSLGGGFYYVIISLAVLAILVKTKFAYYLTGVFFVLFSIIGAGFVTGTLQPVVDLNELSQNGTHWATFLISLFSLALIFIYGFGTFHKELIKVLNKSDSNETKYKVLFQEANDAILLLKEGKFFDCNLKAIQMFEMEKHEFYGKTVLDVSPVDQPDGQKSNRKAMALVSRALDGFPQSFEWQHKKSNGDVFDVSITLSKIELHNEVYAQGIIRDITERKQKDAELDLHRNQLEKMVENKTIDLNEALSLSKKKSEDLLEKQKIIQSKNEELRRAFDHLKDSQAKLLQTEKMASLGILVAGVAHEINNPLNYISGAFYGLKGHFEDTPATDNKEEVESLLQAIKEGVDRTAAIVKSLNQFSRENDSFDEYCNIHLIIDNALIMINNRLKYKIEVEKQYTVESPVIKGNVGKLHQVFLNILTNSVDAIDDKGKITIVTIPVDNSLQISIKDNGQGISPENVKKVMDPFYTTKDPGKGTGLGLSVTLNIIKDHGGEIKLESGLNIGTTLQVKLPFERA